MLHFFLQLCEGLLGLSTVYIQKENMIEAKKLMTRALELATYVLGVKHHFVAAIFTRVRNISWIYNYPYLCISPLMLGVRTPLRRGVLDTILCGKICQ